MPILGKSCVLVLLMAVPLAAQQPVQPPPDQYPAGQYPPGQYPPGQYPPQQAPTQQAPPNTVPARLPGGGTLNIPVPEIKLPKKKGKNDKDLKMELKDIEGTLRKLGEKELVLENPEKKILRFRLLAKTQFRNKEGEAIRDSLLKPGDQLSVGVHPDDEETAWRVTFVRAGSEAERAAASQPIEGSANAPVPAPAGAPTAAPTAAPAEKDPPRPVLKPGKTAGETAAPGEWLDAEALDAQRFGDKVIQEARDNAFALVDSMPDFLVQQFTTRYVSNTVPARWYARDVVEAEVACVKGKEEYRNVSINGKRSKKPVEKTGAWSTGEFVTTLRDILNPGTQAKFTLRGDDRLFSRSVVVYDFSVLQARSNWHIVSPEGTEATPAYKGALWIDRATHNVLRIEKQTLSLPREFPFDKAETFLDYDFTPIDAGTYLLPVRSENLSCRRGTSECTRNEIAFRNYRKFAAESNVKFDLASKKK